MSKLFLVFSVFITMIQFTNQCANAGVKSCDARRIELESFVSTAGAVLKKYPDGTILPSPMLNREAYQGADAAYLTTSNQQNFDMRLRPMFEALRNLLVQKLQGLTNPQRREMLVNRIQRLHLVSRSWERCERAGRPPIAAAVDLDDPNTNEVMICPFVTHMAAEAVISDLAHEMGHLVDICLLGTEAEQANISSEGAKLCQNGQVTDQGEFAGYPFAKIQCCTAGQNFLPTPSDATRICSRNEEFYANNISAQLTADFLKQQMASPNPIIHLDTDKQMRDISILFIGLHGFHGDFFLQPQLQTPLYKDLLECDGIPVHTGCQDKDFE